MIIIAWFFMPMVSALVSLSSPLQFDGDYQTYLSPRQADALLERLKASSSNVNTTELRDSTLKVIESSNSSVSPSTGRALESTSKVTDSSGADSSSTMCNGSSSNGGSNNRINCEDSSGNSTEKIRYQRKPFFIVGVTNPFMLRTFSEVILINSYYLLSIQIMIEYL